jgi:hypothetical protein
MVTFCCSFQFKGRENTLPEPRALVLGGLRKWFKDKETAMFEFALYFFGVLVSVLFLGIIMFAGWLDRLSNGTYDQQEIYEKLISTSTFCRICDRIGQKYTKIVMLVMLIMMRVVPKFTLVVFAILAGVVLVDTQPIVRVESLVDVSNPTLATTMTECNGLSISAERDGDTCIWWSKSGMAIFTSVTVANQRVNGPVGACSVTCSRPSATDDSMCAQEAVWIR